MRDVANHLVDKNSEPKLVSPQVMVLFIYFVYL